MQFWESLGQQWGVLKQKLPVGGVPHEVDSPSFRVFVVLSHWLETGFGKFGLVVNTVVEKNVHSCRLSVTYVPCKFSWKKMATGRKQEGSTSLAATLPALIQLISPKGSQEIAAPLPRVTQTLLEGSPLAGSGHRQRWSLLRRQNLRTLEVPNSLKISPPSLNLLLDV